MSFGQEYKEACDSMKSAKKEFDSFKNGTAKKSVEDMNEMVMEAFSKTMWVGCKAVFSGGAEVVGGIWGLLSWDSRNMTKIHKWMMKTCWGK